MSIIAYIWKTMIKQSSKSYRTFKYSNKAICITPHLNFNFTKFISYLCAIDDLYKLLLFHRKLAPFTFRCVQVILILIPGVKGKGGFAIGGEVIFKV